MFLQINTGGKSKCKHCCQNKDTSSSSLDYNSDSKWKDRENVLVDICETKPGDNLDLRLSESTNDNKSLPSYYYPTTSPSSSVSTSSNCSRYLTLIEE